MIPAIEIDQQGNIRTLYTDELDLYALGQVHNVRRASHLEFDEKNQEWEVVQASTGKVVHRDKNRQRAIDWEIKELGVGGKYDVQG